MHSRPEARLTPEEERRLRVLAARYTKKHLRVALGTSFAGLEKLRDGGFATRAFVDRIVAGIARLEAASSAPCDAKPTNSTR